MTLPLTPDLLQASYDFLCETPPFKKWSMPPGDEVAFHVGAFVDKFGEYSRNGKKYPVGTHHITISMKCVGHTGTLLRTMAHEMIHLWQAVKKSETRHAEHNAEFRRLSLYVCKFHGFDPREF